MYSLVTTVSEVLHTSLHYNLKVDKRVDFRCSYHKNELVIIWQEGSVS